MLEVKEASGIKWFKEIRTLVEVLPNKVCWSLFLVACLTLSIPDPLRGVALCLESSRNAELHAEAGSTSENSRGAQPAQKFWQCHT